MSNSPLVNHVNLSPNHSGRRKHKIDRITIHHMAGNLSVETCGLVFKAVSRQASSNYAVDSKGRVGMYVEEHNRSWCSSSPENDHRAITIEVANDEIGGSWHVSNVALEKIIELCVDICKRNGIKALNYTGDTKGNLTKHEWFANTNCPGPYLGSKFPYIASEVNKRLNQKLTKEVTPEGLFRVRASWNDAKSQKGAFRHFENAKACADKYGYRVFDEKGNTVYPVSKENLKDILDISKEVIDGKWGNGSDRKKTLLHAGYDYNLVQAKVNELLSEQSSKALKTIDDIAKEVINGKWGNGQDRKNRLSKAGYDYSAIQRKVNEMI
ncbi:N-acetylmuramoyl-L-alanine amidase [Streptococcus sp. 20-1249]|uniref:N-acetylmuramoyl-L-alanine amidase n=1 Tax=Streptococcus hepaticus TaxID=3349163 RepID=UPI003748F54A